jgi:hypothetical protein
MAIRAEKLEYFWETIPISPSVDTPLFAFENFSTMLRAVVVDMVKLKIFGYFSMAANALASLGLNASASMFFIIFFIIG